MSEKSNPNKNKYTYKYVQFTVTPREKKQIKHFANKENFKTTSEFVRRIVFEYIRRQENPELFHPPVNNSINLQMERIAKDYSGNHEKPRHFSAEGRYNRGNLCRFQRFLYKFLINH